MTTRRDFLANGGLFLSATLTGCLSTRRVGVCEDWKRVFKTMGFDPDADGCGVFAVIGDPHVTDGINAPLADAVRIWNAMSPQPKFALSVGDQLCHVSLQFGDRETPAKPGWQAETDRECAILHGIVDRLEIPFKHVIGNHDTYPEEVDAKCRAERTAKGYRVEGSVALSELRDLGVNPKQFWLGAFRADYDERENLVAWCSLLPPGPGEADFHRPCMLFKAESRDLSGVSTLH